MKIPCTSYMDHCIESVEGVDLPMSKIMPAIRRVFRKMDRMLTAIAYAEAGDLDAVKAMLDEDKARVRK